MIDDGILYIDVDIYVLVSLISYGFCYLIVFVSAAVSLFVPGVVSYTDAYGSTLFSPSAQNAVEHIVALAKVTVILFKKLSSLYISLLKLIL